MRGSTLGLVWYRFRTTLKAQRGGFLAVVLLTGVLGGLAMGAITAARVTGASFVDFEAATNTGDVGLIDGTLDPAIGLNSGYNPALLRTISHLPHIEHLESQVGLNIGPVTKNDQPLPASLGTGPFGSVDGLYFDEDRVVVTQGRLADPSRPDEFVLDTATAKLFGYHVGETVTLGYATNAQSSSGNFTVPRHQLIRATLVGVGAIDTEGLFQDQSSPNSGVELFTPALTRQLLNCCSNDMISEFKVKGGSRYDGLVESELRSVLPKGLPFTFIQSSDAQARAERTLRPEGIALATFGGIAALAALLITGQVIGRRIRLNVGDRNVMRALGADPTMTASDGLIGTLSAVVLGAVLAGLVAVSLSPLAPLGPVRPYLPVTLHFDWLVIGTGVAVLVLGLSTLAVVLSYRTAPHHPPGPARQTGSSATRLAAATGLPPPAVTGIRFALEPGAGRNAVPVRSAIAGAILALVVVTSTLTFGSSMNTLISNPPLFGWNWTYEIDGGGGLGDIPGPDAATLLDADHYVAAWAGVYFSNLQIDGMNVPVMGGSPGAAVAPPLLSGHAFDGSDQVVLGPATLTQLRRKIGDQVQVRVSATKVTKLTVVGTATMPAIGVAGSSHLEMGNGALLSYKLIPPQARNVFDSPSPGPNAILVRLKNGSDTAAGLRSLQSIGAKLQIVGNGGSVLPVQHPAEILNYRSLGTVPTLLGAALAVGAVIALGLTLVTSVRRRRRDLALLKTLGFTKRQLASTIAWQATIAVGIGCLVGIPLGIALGRYLWDLFARSINAVPDPVVPAASLLLVAVIALVLANLVAGVPGRIAARTPTAQLLRSE